jgi:hypothetical protein
MRRVVLTLSVVAILGLAATEALAGNGFREVPNGYGQPAPFYALAPYYGPYVPMPYHGGYVAPYYGGYSSPQDESAARIRASASRYRYYTHPRSLYNSPPRAADYFGWGW